MNCQLRRILVFLVLLLWFQPIYIRLNAKGFSATDKPFTGPGDYQDKSNIEADGPDDEEVVIEEPDSGPDPAFDEAEPLLDENPDPTERDTDRTTGTNEDDRTGL